MGNNAAFSQFEHFTIATYNAGALTTELLSQFMEFYRDVDIDHGGMRGTTTTDGLDVEEVVLKTFGVELPKRPDLPKDHKTWSEKQSSQNDEYWDTRCDMFAEISNKFGWS